MPPIKIGFRLIFDLLKIEMHYACFCGMTACRKLENLAYCQNYLYLIVCVVCGRQIFAYKCVLLVLLFQFLSKNAIPFGNSIFILL